MKCFNPLQSNSRDCHRGIQPGGSANQVNGQIKAAQTSLRHRSSVPIAGPPGLALASFNRLRSPWDTLRFACLTEYFPLTLALSLREREEQASDWCFVDGYWANSGTGVIARRWTILALPRERAAVRGNRM